MAAAALWSCALLLCSLAGAPDVRAAEVSLAQFSSAPGAQPPAPWRVVGVPGGKIPLTDFALTTLDGRKVVRVTTAGSYGNLVHDLPPQPSGPTMRLQWRWQLEAPLRGANLRIRQGDDSPLKVCVLFDMPLDQLGFVERNLLRVARAASAENLPSATLCYVWDHTLEPETLLANAYTSRVRMIVVNQGEQQLGQWVAHSRALSADFLRAFGAETSSVPPILAVLIGGDSDNTAGRSVGYIGDVQLDR